MIPENQTSRWIDRQIEDFLIVHQFGVQVHYIGQTDEEFLPLDSLFQIDGTRLFGLQHKSLYRSKSNPRPSNEAPYAYDSDYWKFDTRQESALLAFDWIHYALCEVVSRLHGPTALHLTYFPAHLEVEPDYWGRRYWGSVWRRGSGGRLRRGSLRSSQEVLKRWPDLFWAILEGDASVVVGTEAEAKRVFQSAIEAAGDPDQLSAQRLDHLALTLVAVNPNLRQAILFSTAAPIDDLLTN